MIAILRKIRLKLLSNKRFSKYIFYAAGEIILVVVGILIALQVNNWNEQRKVSSTEIQYLKRLHSDLANDTAYYHRRITYADKVIADHKEVIKRSYLEITSSREFFDMFHILNWSAEALSIRDNTYSEMENAGQINIISNETLRTELLEFYRQVDLVAKHFDEINATFTVFMTDFFIKSQAHKHFWSYGAEWAPWTEEMLEKSDDWQWINDPTSEAFKSFQSSLSFYSGKQIYFKEYCTKLLDNSKILLLEIENEFINRSIPIPEPKVEPIFVLD